MAWAWKLDINPTEKFILLALADHANDEEFTCWPSLNHLQKKTGFTRPTIWKAVDKLISLGAVSRTGQSSFGTTVYRVMVGKEITLGKEVNQVTTLPMVGKEINKVGKEVSKLGKEVTPNHKNHQESSIEPSRLNHDAWKRWVNYRKEIRKPLKPVSIPAAQRKLAAFGSDQTAVVEQSIANGWQGLFELKEKREPSSRIEAAIREIKDG